MIIIDECGEFTNTPDNIDHARALRLRPCLAEWFAFKEKPDGEIEEVYAHLCGLPRDHEGNHICVRCDEAHNPACIERT